MVEEWTLKGSIYTIKNKNVNQTIKRKLHVMLSHYSANPHRSENKVIQCVAKLQEQCFYTKKQ